MKAIFLVLTFSVYSWCLYHIAYARGAWVEMTGDQRALRSCQELIQNNHGDKYDQLCTVFHRGIDTGTHQSAGIIR